MRISKFASSIAPSATMAAGAKAKQLKDSGIEVFDFTLGEPDFPTPDHIKQSAIDALAKNHTHYTAAMGIAPLRQAIAKYHREWHNLPYEAANICVSGGSKQAIHNALQATLNPGDEVILPAPYWVSYFDLIKMVGAVPVVVPTTKEERFLLTAEKFRAACTPRTRMLLINSPSNPTGSAYSKGELEQLAKVVLEKDLLILSDEIYARLLYDDHEFHSIASFGQEVFDRSIVVNGVSKTYAMTGWRIGWAAGPANVISAIGGIQSQEAGNASSIGQYATLDALSGDQSCVEVMRKEFVKRRDAGIRKLNAIPGFKVRPPEGAFYLFFDVRSAFGKTYGGQLVNNSESFCLTALDQAHVALVHGSAFGMEGFVRMSFACSMENIERGLDALAGWLAEGK